MTSWIDHFVKYLIQKRVNYILLKSEENGARIGEKITKIEINKFPI